MLTMDPMHRMSFLNGLSASGLPPFQCIIGCNVPPLQYNIQYLLSSLFTAWTKKAKQVLC